MTGMIPRLLDRLGRYARQVGVFRGLQPIEMQQLEHGHQELPRRREREIATRQLHDLRVAELDTLAKIRERVSRSPLPFDLTRQLEKQVRLADQVERGIRQRDVLLEDRTMAAPLGRAMTEDESVVAESEEVFAEHRNGWSLIAYRLSLIAYRLSLIAYRLSLIAYRLSL